MPLHQAVILGSVQGLAEFLPISSSGHLILFRQLMHWPDPGLYFDVALHAGTLLAVLVYFRALWIDLARGALGAGTPKDRALLGWLVAASVPGAVAGKLLEKYAEEAFRRPELISVMLIGVAALMWRAERTAAQQRTHEDLALGDAVKIGAAQAAAVIPGVSRSGATIAAGLACGLTRGAAARLSFLMSAPIIGGATLLGALHLRRQGIPPEMKPAFLIGMLCSAVVGYSALSGFLRYLQTRTLGVFIAYRVAAGAAVLALAFGGYFK